MAAHTSSSPAKTAGGIATAKHIERSAGMAAHVTLELPSILRNVLGRGSLTVEGHTLSEALEDGYAQLPGLRVHLVDESGKFRPHVLCFINDVNSRWLEAGDPLLHDGDTITILQAVSGG